MSDLSASPVVSQRQRVRSQVLLLVIADTLAVLAAGLVSTLLRFGDLQATVRLEGSDFTLTFPLLVAWTVPLWIAFLWMEGLYGQRGTAQTPGYLGRIARALAFGGIALVLVTYALKLPGLSRGWLVTYVVVAFIAVVLARAIVDLTVTSLHLRGRWLRPTLVVGSNPEGADIVRVLRANPASGLVPVGCLASSMADKLDLQFCEPGVPCLGAAREILDVIAEHPVDTVVIASSAFDHDVLARIVAELRTLDVDVHVSSGLFEVLTSRVLVSEIAGVPLITVKGISLSPANSRSKRAFDLVVSRLRTSGRSADLGRVRVARQDHESRSGLLRRRSASAENGEPFRMFKFRSMYADADAALASFACEQRGDAARSSRCATTRASRRSASGCASSRSTSSRSSSTCSRGEMSLVGPRPPLPARDVGRYTEQDWRRLEVLPGHDGLVAGVGALER